MNRRVSRNAKPVWYRWSKEKLVKVSVKEVLVDLVSVRRGELSEAKLSELKLRELKLSESKLPESKLLGLGLPNVASNALSTGIR